MIKVNMVKARAIYREHLRSLRTPLLAKLDIEFMRAIELGDLDLQKEITSKKEALRDITDIAEIDLAETPEELKMIIPEILLNK